MPTDNLKVPWWVLKALVCWTMITCWKSSCYVTKHMRGSTSLRLWASWNYQFSSQNIKLYFHTQVFICLKRLHILIPSKWPVLMNICLSLWSPEQSSDVMGEKAFCSCEFSIPNLFPQYSLGLVWAIYLCFLDCHVQPWVILQYNNLRNKILVNSSMGG